ncbi:hypothetical protein KY347_03200 [Candidatus Woesearchaeota archaeon]|nr:hypothetical protein [Candidatus Woesearchaeota archaeon]
MKIKFTQIILIAYLILISIITKNIQLVSWGLFLLAFTIFYLLSENKTVGSIENLVYILIALTPFPYLLSLFVLYLPFAVFGLLLAKRNFIKSYALGFAISLIPTILLYTSSNYLNLPLSFFTVSLFFCIPIIAAIFIIARKKTMDFLKIGLKEYFIILIVLASTIFVAWGMVNDNSLFISNGTYMYTKFNMIVKSVESSKTFPIYDPATSSGESPFLFETPLFFSHLAFANIILKFIPPVAFYNLYSLFILFLSTISLSLLLGALLNLPNETKIKNRMSYIIVIALGSLSIGLNFYFVQYLEAFKEFFTFPINYLIFSLILEKPKRIEEIILIFYMVVLTFITHTSHGVGIVLISLSLIFLIFLKLFASKELHYAKAWIVQNRFKLIAAGFIIVLLPLFYIAPAFIFKDFLEDKGEINFQNTIPNSIAYLKEFTFGVDSPLSFKYPDITRNDDKKFGPSISVFGLFALFVSLACLKSKNLGNLRLFSGAYLLHFLISSIIVIHPMIGSLEYGYRTAAPYLLIILAASICAFIIIVKQKYVRILLLILFFISFVYTLPLAKQNIENIHREEFISGKSFESEINVAKNLPKDGRIITYGLFANAIDPGMASLTGRYFSRYHLTEYARSRSIYWKIHGTNSFGQEDFVLNKSAIEMSNYLKMGGYKYIFANICHPIGNFIAQILYPKFAQVIYQSQNQCFVFLVVNNTSYAEKVSILKDFDEEVYKNEEGFKYYSLSKHFNFGNDIPYSEDAIKPEALNFERISPVEVKIYGDFNNDEWVVFKEDYFSRWKAYMDGKEVPILATNHNLILTKTIEGNGIKLKYSVLPLERFIGSVSLIAALLLLAIFLIFLRKWE